MRERIERAFEGRGVPNKLIDAPDDEWLDSDQRDAVWFRNRNWDSITWEEWVEHRCALFQFSADAFAYYLPGVMIVSSSRPDEWLIAADSIISMLATGTALKAWSPARRSNFLALRREELEVLQEWLRFLRDTSAYGEDEHDMDDMDRAIQTVELLKLENELR